MGRKKGESGKDFFARVGKSEGGGAFAVGDAPFVTSGMTRPGGQSNVTQSFSIGGPAIGIDVPPGKDMRGVAEVAETMRSPGLGFERVDLIPGSTYKDNSTVVVIPTRGMIHHRVVQSWQGMISPMNGKKAVLFAVGHEVGKAYDAMIANILVNPELSKWKYVLTLEDDNIQPADAHIRLLETIEWGKFDAVSGIYFTKFDINMPMAYGDPEEYRRTGVLDFKPRDVRNALANGNIMPVNGIAMGCALYRMDLFREIPPPWFVTVADVVEGKGASLMTQDLFFAEKMCRAGKTSAVDMRVKVGHLDVNSGVVY